MFGTGMTALQGFTLGVAVVSAALSLFTALLGDWFKERFGFRGMGKLSVEIEDRKPYFSHAWIRNVSSIIPGDDHIQSYEGDRVRVQVLRVRVRNTGHNAAKQVSLWLTGLSDTTNTNDRTVDENVMGLRWADTWRFVTDKSEGTVTPSDTEMNFPLIPAQSAKFCDVCVFYDPRGPDRLDQFERGRLYLAIYNMPARTYSKGPGRFELELQAVAENARPARIKLVLEFEPRSEGPALRVIHSSKR